MPEFQAKDPAYAQRVQASFDRQGVMKLLGARVSRIAPGECEIQLPYRNDLTQQHGYFHGGIIGTIADSAGGLCRLLADAGGCQRADGGI